MFAVKQNELIEPSDVIVKYKIPLRLQNGINIVMYAVRISELY